jgi:peptidoglycan/LPS O-acetylase OafA/YrhL
VVLPAILLTYVLDRIGMARDPSLYDAGRETMPLWRGAAAALFLSESWYREVALFSNSSYWSLPYEFWYYVMFGAALFLRGKTRIAAIIAAALIAGPNILLLFPNWLVGVLAYRQSRKAPPGRSAPLLFAVSILLTLGGYAAREAGLIPSYSSDYLPFAYSLSDYVIGAGIALNLYAGSGMEFAFLRRFKTIIREAAGVTFSLYLFHLPIMYCLATFMPQGLPLAVRFATMVGASFVICAGLSRFTEHHKDGLRDWLAGLFGNLSRGKPLLEAADKT